MTELLNELPMDTEVLNKMDKAAVVKLAIFFFKMKQFLQRDLATYGHKAITDFKPCPPIKKPQSGEAQLMLEALNGFLVFVNKKGSVKFISNTVTDHLGFKQEHMIGKSILDYIHPSDHKEVHKQFIVDGKQPPPGTLCEEPQRVFYVRMKFNLTKPGTKTKQSGYMLVQWSGKMKRHLSSKTGQCTMDGLLCVCRPMQTTPLVEIRMDGNMFMSRHDLGMTFTFCDSRIITLIGYEPNEVVGKTAYNFHNPIDAPKVSICHQNLIAKGSSVSKYYRFISKNEAWVWLQTRATIIYNTANKAQYIVCMNYVISEEEGERYLMLEEHQNANNREETTILTLPDNQHHPITLEPQIMGPRIVELEEQNLVSTAKYCEQQLMQCSMPMKGVEHVAATSGDGAVGLAGDCDGTQMQVASRDLGSMETEDVPQLNDSPLVSMTPSLSLPNQPDGASKDQETLDLNAPVDSPETSTSTLSNNGSPSALSNDEAANMNYSNHNVVGFQQMNVICGNNFSPSESDTGYESSSPYTNYQSPQRMVSPGACSDGAGFSNLDDDHSRGFIQGQNLSMAPAFSPSPSVQSMSSVSMDGTNTAMDDESLDFSRADNYLDQILQQLSNKGSAESIYSTIESLVTQNEASISTNVRSPNVLPNSSLNGHTLNSLQNSYSCPQLQSQQGIPFSTRASQKSKSVLRDVLTMPEKELNIISKFNTGSKRGQKRSCAKTVTSAQSIPSSFGCRNNDSNGVFSATNCLNRKPPQKSCQTPTSNDTEGLDLQGMFPGIPDDISDFAMQYLDGVIDTQAQAVIGEIQTGVAEDSFMDTSDDPFLAKELINSLETQCGPSQSGLGNVLCNSAKVNLNFSSSSQCRSQFPDSAGVSCMNTQRQFMEDPLMNETHSTGANGLLGNSSHDHLYHQNVSSGNSLSRSRSQKIPESPMSSFFRQNNDMEYSSASAQTQTSEYCLSELEKHLRNRRSEACRNQNQADSTAVLSTSPKPFLQQLLTGELTKDMYMRMERKRFQEGSS
ncbi:hypoxia-inducible factor 1-alpha-like isoform X2 [Mya arenaria]|nr:hypoxia-inducible factor 1-alpha-like isoform X2 [Mya arenaria]XP_052766704.1 hypoxia-inducible factor 1-alpha-like isoform X2 [Mya arenaria]